MSAEIEPPSGLWLPLITPFRDGALDATSLRRLIAHFARIPLDGLILGATTGEGMTLDDDEIEQLVMITAAALAESGRAMPVYLGLSGSYTSKLVKSLARTANWPLDGYLIACPSYTRPSQRGLVLHFEALAEATARPIMIYNIPYRTGVNLGNAAMLQLAARRNIVGVKNCCGDTLQTVDLLRKRPAGFAVLTGEDALFFGDLVRGCDGAILASAHVETETFAFVRQQVLSDDRLGASMQWNQLAEVPRLLFAEPSPAPLKHWLWRQGLIDSPELRLPMVAIGADLADAIDRRVLPAKTGA
ncbi:MULTISPECIES: 4-hydroxy-tetrahydrodipicolinate synthase [Rhodopseudomonas]|uniref:4-hydroxy-tetrahydrodipicolinate synthase n=1 Tax=Rhodopseudomonas palustris TaxID=1076 RepID=A0A0D7DZK4_RHOPL|nr:MULTISPECIES: 4-hydroxy-tetrahydrodipicolinate synthase [Rhodopseudomonas]KIZ34013.1 dihydrodipicolinate synthase [Rhodopseudomonas palustris]MDF3813827.1 4-hydroxy-tetrahydrodipicolinate synthase [Rhodopseudomonas sp. BAL398]WOK17136.1 4-hydroxy-tetrahydrodipicolinate synthase [Rhodopseudomonas sp. BAL398]